MKQIYLTKELKDFYLKDFEQSLTTDDDFWKIEKSIKDYLININKNNRLQTLYSKNGQNNFFNDSYLTFCYTSDLEQMLLKVCIPKILSKFNNLSKSCCFYEFSYPRKNENYNPDRSLGFSCTDNENHFKINHIKIILKSRDKKIHSDFWICLTEELINI